MVGKLDIGTDNGDYAFDIRAARATAEAAAAGATPGTITPAPSGPYTSAAGGPFWFRRRDNGRVQVGFNIDSDPDPDIWRRLVRFVSNDSVDPDYRADIRAQAIALGWNEVD